MKKQQRALNFGPNKYAAFHLLIARWIRLGTASMRQKYCYVTLGGTQLRDIESFYFIDRDLLAPPVSFEQETERHQLAKLSIDRLAHENIVVELRNGSIFDYSRPRQDTPHLFFLDIEGIFAWADYNEQLCNMLQRETITEGDTIFITSYLGRNRGWERIFDIFAAEFSMVDAFSVDRKKAVYKRAHPSFTLFHALDRAGLTTDLRIQCIGCVEYRDTSTMGIYGYTVSSGRTSFRELIYSQTAAYFEILGVGYQQSYIP